MKYAVKFIIENNDDDNLFQIVVDDQNNIHTVYYDTMWMHESVTFKINGKVVDSDPIFRQEIEYKTIDLDELLEEDEDADEDEIIEDLIRQAKIAARQLTADEAAAQATAEAEAKAKADADAEAQRKAKEAAERAEEEVRLAKVKAEKADKMAKIEAICRNYTISQRKAAHKAVKAKVGYWIVKVQDGCSVFEYLNYVIRYNFWTGKCD